MERVKTGIQRLDKALEGGIPKNNIVLVSGGAGTGKSTLCLQFLYNGARLFGESAVYFTTEQNERELKKQGKTFGWDLEELQRKNLLKIHYFDIAGKDGFLEKIYDVYSQFSPKRIVIDSLTTFTDSLLVSGVDEEEFSPVKVAQTVYPVPRTEQFIAKSMLYHLLKKLRLFDSTVLMTSELPEKTGHLSADQISEFICDGVMLLEYLGVGAHVFRSLRIRKMRYTNHEKASLAYEMTNEGISFTSQELRL